MYYRKCVLRHVILLAACAATIGTANAQDTGSGDSAAQGDESNRLEEVVVTSSRVITNGNDAPTAITIVTVDDMLTAKPTSVFETLSELPVFSGTNGLPGAPVVTQPDNVNVPSLNLRNLGGTRTLVLFDGRRMPSTSADGYTDPNMIPQMLLQRVEVVTGGASAVYGSDAITGVVNFIVDRNFTGVRAKLQAGSSGYHDADSSRIGVAYGTDLFGGRGHFMASYEKHSVDGVLDKELNKNKRKWLRPDWTLQGNGSPDNPYHLQDNVRITNTSFGGLIRSGQAYVGYHFDENGVLTPFEFGSSEGLASSNIRIGGDGAWINAPSLTSDEELEQFFARFDYDISDRTRVFLSASASQRDMFGYLTNLRNVGSGFSVGACNAFLSEQYQTALGCTPANSGTVDEPTFRLAKYWDGYSPGNTRVTFDDTNKNTFLIGGLEGEFADGYSWEMSYAHGKSTSNIRAPRNNNLARNYAMLDAVIDPATEQIVCRVELTNPGVYPGCVPLNPFGPTAHSQEAMDYQLGLVGVISTHKSDSVSGSVTGSPFSTWAGEVDVAISGEFRQQSYQLDSDSTPDRYADCTGLRFGNCIQGRTLEWLLSRAARPEVTQDTVEAAIEFNAPLLRNAGFADALDLNAGLRHTRYSNDPQGDLLLSKRSISADTWKIGLTWDISESVTLRATRSKDFRAPNLYDLYTPVAVNPRGQHIDYLLPGSPLINAATIQGGNPNLDPEIGHTTTIGVVWRPTSNFSISVDAYDIKIKDALAELDGDDEAVHQVCYDSGGTSPMCDLIERPFPITNTTLENALTAVYERRINVASQSTHGFDVDANWSADLFGRPFSLRGLMTYQPELIYNLPPLQPQDQAGAHINGTFSLQPAPKTKAMLFAHLDLTDQVRVAVSQRYRSSMKWSADPDRQNFIGGIPSVTYTNLNVSYDMESSLGLVNFYLNIQNLFDKDPPPAAASNRQTSPGDARNGFVLGDDILGRYYSLGAQLHF